MIAGSPAALVGLGGALGAILRYATTRLVDREAFPFGTLAVYVLGSFALGARVFAGVADDAMLALGVGACGSFTTFSSFAHDTVRLYEAGRRGRAVANAVGTFAAALGAVGVAWLLFG